MATEQKPVEDKKVKVTSPDEKVDVKEQAPKSKSQERREAVQAKAKKADKKAKKTKEAPVAPVNLANQPPAGAKQADIDPVVRKEPEQTFEERTSGVNQPWLNEDGSQNTGE